MKVSQILERLQFKVDETMLNFVSRYINCVQLRKAISSAINDYENDEPSKQWVSIENQ